MPGMRCEAPQKTPLAGPMGQFCGQLSVWLALYLGGTESDNHALPIGCHRGVARFTRLVKSIHSMDGRALPSVVPHPSCLSDLYVQRQRGLREANREGACVGEAALRALQGDPPSRRRDGDL